MRVTSPRQIDLTGFRFSAAALLIASFCNASAVWSQETDDEFGDHTGLIVTYRSGDNVVREADDLISVDWQDRSPDPRITAEHFAADWSGRVLIRQAGTYRLHLYLTGLATVTIDDREIVSANTAAAKWVTSDEFKLDFGERDLQVQFEKSAPSARIHLFWSSEHFPLEPIASTLFYRDALPAEDRLVDRGRELFDVYRCGRCHRRDDAPLPPAAPSLELAAGGLSAEWILRKLLEHQPAEHLSAAYREKMPRFQLSVREAQGVVAYLKDKSKPIELPEFKSPDDVSKQTAEGRVKLLSLGCLACHHIDDAYADVLPPALWNGGSLTAVGAKRSAAWLAHWLSRPQDLNADHRMPVFEMDATERAQLVLALSELKRPLESRLSADDLRIDPFDTELVAVGARVLRERNCTACHRVPQMEHAPKSTISPLTAEDINWDNSCIAETPLGEKHPQYVDLDRDAIREYVNSRRQPLSPLSLDLAGRRTLEQNNCLACHPRSNTRGLTPLAGHLAADVDAFRGRSSELIPPPLTAVGDKLFDTALIEAVAGQQKRRLPWLQVRMPKFAHSADDKAALAHHLIGRDRIPDGAPATPEPSLDVPPQQQLVIGHTLVGGRGFSCIACHTAGNFQPRGVALGSRGSDLLMLQTRMRKEFFMRWTRSPLRIVQGVEMPSYQQAKPGILGSNIDAQLEAIWLALNDSNFTVPTNPGSVEQYLVLKPSDPPRVVRDVFTLPEASDDDFVPRSFAVGLPNGHSLLVDLDTGAIRQWTIGDFARQRTQGKSWFWDMAGVTLMTGIGEQPDIVLSRGESIVEPIAVDDIIARLDDYRLTNDQVEMTYRLTFVLDDEQCEVTVTEQFSVEPLLSSTEGTGWLRSIRVDDVPDGYTALVRRPLPSYRFGDAIVSASSAWKKTEQGEFAPLPLTDDGTEILLSYRTTLKPTTAGDVPLPIPDVTIPEAVKTVPGFDGVRLPVDGSIMPTAITWTDSGAMAFTSLRGDVYLAEDADGDGLEDSLTKFESGLAAPFGIIADGDALIVAHKPELLRLCDADGDEQADERQVLATGWGYSEDYHDWTCGIVRDSQDRLYVALGSDYGQPKRPRDKIRWRGKALRVDPDGTVTLVAHDLRFPTGLAIDHLDRVFITDQQGVQNPWNELNLLVDGKHYGVPSQSELDKNEPGIPPAVQIPHPWTRSVNGIAFIPDDSPIEPWRGHGIGCEYDMRFLIRYSIQQVGDVVQGAIYPLSKEVPDRGGENFVGPIAVAVGPQGDIYVGSIHDSGWQGGINTGAIEKLSFTGELPLGIQEVTAVPEGFEITFTAPVDRDEAMRAENFTVSGYTRVYQGGYYTPDSGRFEPAIERIDVADDGRSVRLHLAGLRTGYVYDIHCGKFGENGEELWPSAAHYTLHRLPARDAN